MIPARVYRFLTVVAAVVAIDWLVKLGVHTLTSPPVLNSDPIPWWLVPLLLAAGILVVWEFDRPLATVACGIGIGGGSANGLGRLLFGPVADYIPEPFRDGWYCNVADLAIFGAAPVLVYLTLSHWYRTFRPAPLPEPGY